MIKVFQIQEFKIIHSQEITKSSYNPKEYMIIVQSHLIRHQIQQSLWIVLQIQVIMKHLIITIFQMRCQQKQQQISQYQMKQIVLESISNEQIEFRYQQHGDEGMFILLSNDCSHIKKIKLSFTQITHMGVMNFPLANWSNLIYLFLPNNKIGSKGCKYISKTDCSKLKQISLGNNQIGSEGAIHISKAKWKVVQALYLWSNKISTNGVNWLVRANFRKLNKLSIGKFEITPN